MGLVPCAVFKTVERPHGFAGVFDSHSLPPPAVILKDHMEQAIVVVAEFQAKPGHEAEAQALLQSMLEPTRKEEGCFRYDLHADVDLAGHFFMIESWSSRAAVELHLTKPHIASVLPKLAELAVGPARILFLNQIG